jgi:TatD DNase family protein
VPKRGRTNEPSFIPHTAKMLADLFDLDSEELGRITSNNFFKLFTKAQF